MLKGHGIHQRFSYLLYLIMLNKTFMVVMVVIFTNLLASLKYLKMCYLSFNMVCGQKAFTLTKRTCEVSTKNYLLCYWD